MTYVHTAWPYQPAGVTAAQMNLFFGLATVARRLDIGVADYTEEKLADPALLDFMHRITVFDDPAINARGRAARHACRMTLTTRAGMTLHREIFERRGSPENPVGRAAIEAKFRANVRHCLADEAAGQMMALIADFERLESTAALTTLLAQAIS